MKKAYEKPVVVTEGVFETLASGCTFYSIADPQCDPNQNPAPGATPLNS
jgi:hypothetical protein